MPWLGTSKQEESSEKQETESITANSFEEKLGGVSRNWCGCIKSVLKKLHSKKNGQKRKECNQRNHTEAQPCPQGGV